MEEHPTQAALLAKAWSTFEEEMLNSLGDIPDELRELAKKSFYAGELGMLGMVQSALQQANSPEARRQLLRDLRKAIAQTMDETD